MRTGKFTENNSSSSRPLTVIAFFALSFIFVGCIYAAFAEDDCGRTHFIEGKNDLDAGRYEKAVENLLAAEKDFPVLADYSLYYLSEAYHKLGEHKKALDLARTLLEKYPASPLARKVRLCEIREAKENSDEKLLQLYKGYLKDYPEDDEVSLMYGLYLRQTGEPAKAAAVFKSVYIRAGGLSDSAYSEMGSGDITPGDLIDRASNLMKRYEFKEAERDLRKALSKDDGKHKRKILKDLGLSLFKQREYAEAALVFDKINDAYYKARSLYRACDKEGFDVALNELLKNNDKRAGELLIAVAADRRREKDPGKALKIYEDIINRYPSEMEDAMWGMGWTYYIESEYRKSGEIFSKLYARYEDAKYLYWQARSTEALGEDPKELYNSLMKMDNNFYSALAYLRNKGSISRPASSNEQVDNQADRRTSERIDTLISLHMNKEAVSEVICLSKKIDTPSGLLYVISKFQELGEFKRSIGLATKIPYSDKLYGFLYPFPFRTDVEKISRKFEMDPLIVLSVMREESRFDAEARSVAGARGLMQVMPQTAYRLDKNLKLGINRESQLLDAGNNINIGTYYLKSLLKEFKSLAHVLAAYNAGEAAVKKWEQQGDYKSADVFIEEIPYAETRNYVKKVLTSYFQYKKAGPGDAAGAGLDIVLGKL